MSRSWTFAALCKEYRCEREEWVHVKRRDEARALLRLSKGKLPGVGRGPIVGTGWYKLAQPSPEFSGARQPVFVCREDLLK